MDICHIWINTRPQEYAELLYQPIADILNSSYKEQKLSSVWKHADVTPVPKVKQLVDPKKELRPISLTASLSKVAEDFMVSGYIRPALERMADLNQFGTESGSSTVLALLSMIHEWLLATDGNNASVRVFLFDYRKAFDFIDHGTLAAKLKEVEVPNSIVNWSWTSCQIGPRGWNSAVTVCLNGEWYQQVSPKGLNWGLGFFCSWSTTS